MAVSKAWKRLLESSPYLWTTFDTSNARRAVGIHALKTHLRRSKYTLNKAVIAGKADFDASKLRYLARTCTQLHSLEMSGSFVIGDSLLSALPLATNLSSLVVNNSTSPKVMLQALQICHKTLTKAVFTFLHGRLDASQKWPTMESLECLDLRVPKGNAILADLVRPYFKDMQS